MTEEKNINPMDPNQNPADGQGAPVPPAPPALGSNLEQAQPKEPATPPEPIMVPEPVQLEPEAPVVPEPMVEVVEPVVVPEPVEVPTAPETHTFEVAPEPMVMPEPIAAPEPEAVAVESEVQTEAVNAEIPSEIAASTEPVAENGNFPDEPSLNEQKAIYSKPKKKKSKVILFGLVGVIVTLLATIGVGLLLFVGNKDGVTNPLFESLGIEVPTIMSFVILVAIVVLGIFTLVALISMLVSLFKMMGAKDDKKRKRKSLLSLILSFVLMAVFGAGLVFASTQLSKFSGEGKSELIITTPAVTTGLTAPVEIQFDATQLPIDLSRFEIIGYVWNFGDGERATGPIVKHTFANKPTDGLYEVELTVQYKDLSDPSSTVQTDTFTRTIGIENQSVAAVFTFDPEEARVPVEIYFNASESMDPDGEIVSFEWDFNDDGEFEGEGEETTHLFEEAGEFKVTLRILDSNGEFTEISKIVTVKDDNIIKPAIALDPDDEFLAPEIAYQFDASGSSSDEGEIVSYEWIFGDGARGEGRKFTHAYSAEGVYTLILKLVDDAGNEREFEKEIRVSSSSSGLFARIQTVPELDGSELYGIVPFIVNFDGGNSSGGEIVDYEWDFDGDGQTDASGKNIEHSFDAVGEFDVFLTITSVDGGSATETIKVFAESAGLQAKISANPVNGTVPLTVTLDAASSRIPNDVEVVSFVWDFDDGTPIDRSSEARVTHRYSQIGTFNPSVKLITSDNDFSEASTVINVNSIPLASCFTMSRKIGPAPLTVSFNSSCTTGTVQGYAWEFGEIGVSTKNKPIFTFEEAGEYTVTLEVLGTDNNISTFEDTVIVE